MNQLEDDGTTIMENSNGARSFPVGLQPCQLFLETV